MTDAELRTRLKKDFDSAHVHHVWSEGDVIPVAILNQHECAAVLALLDRIEAARALHYGVRTNNAYWCNECLDPWPCPTSRALDGTP